MAQILVNPERPAIFDLLFWGIVALILVFRVFDPFDIELIGAGLGTVSAICAALIVSWFALPWHPSASLLGKLVSPVFLLVSIALLFASDLIWALGLFPIAFANWVFLFGTRRAVIPALGIFFLFFAYAFLRANEGLSSSSPEEIVARFALIALLAVVCLGLSTAVMEARRNRDRTEALVEDLEAAHEELRRYAVRVRELTLSEERTRMAREVHDSVGHHLTAVRLQAEAALKTAEKRPEDAVEQMERARDLASEAYEEIRRSVRALGPPRSGERRGTGALRLLVRSFEGTGFDVSFHIGGTERDLPEEVELTIHRALQECLTNSVRHSGGRRVCATLDFGGDLVRLTVTDDGDGVGAGISYGFGLRSLRERVEALEGRFSAGNARDGGFEVEIELPTKRRMENS